MTPDAPTPDDLPLIADALGMNPPGSDYDDPDEHRPAHAEDDPLPPEAPGANGAA